MVLDQFEAYYLAAVVVGWSWLVVGCPVLRYLCFRRARTVGLSFCRRPLTVLSKDPVSTYRVLTSMWVALGLRVVWLIINGANWLQGQSQCLSGLSCSKQVLVTFVNRTAQLMYFATMSRSMAHLGFAAHCAANRYVPTHTGGYMTAATLATKNRVEGLPVMAWDMSHLVLDYWQLILQFGSLVVTLFTPLPDDKVEQLYLGYLLQVGGCYFLIGLLYALVGYQYRHLLYALAYDVGARMTCGYMCCGGGPKEDGAWEEEDDRAVVAMGGRYQSMDEGGRMQDTLQHFLLPPEGGKGSRRRSSVRRSRGSSSATPVATNAHLSQPGRHKRAVYITFACSCMFMAALFIIRSILFLYTPSTGGGKIGGVASEVLYPWWFYAVPEAVPPLIILHTLLPGGVFTVLGERQEWVACITCRWRHGRPMAGHAAAPPSAPGTATMAPLTTIAESRAMARRT